MKQRVAIIGGGSAALMLAATLDAAKFDVTIYEKNFAPARKFLVAGDGGFNLTHSEDIEQFISRYTPASFMEKSLRLFNNQDLREWLKKIGIDTYVGSSKRVFPAKGIKPIDVLNAILAQLKNNGVEIKTGHEWKGWNKSGKLFFRNKNTDVFVDATTTVFAMGGASWCKTGSDGAWADFFAEKNIRLIPFQPSNCAFKINWNKSFISSCEGKALKNILVRCGNKEKKGELVITSFGTEGGAIYALSPQIREDLHARSGATVFIDLKPSLSAAEIKNKLSERTSVTLTQRLKDELKLDAAKIALLKSHTTKDEFSDIEKLAAKIKSLPLAVCGMAPIDEAISTVGGISLEEVDENFQLKKLPDHYAIGEMLDWDAPTGGYLLQACFSMGHRLANKINTDL